MTIRVAIASDVPSMTNLERQCPSAAHWSEHQYKQLFLEEAGLQRLVLVVEERVHISQEAAGLGLPMPVSAIPDLTIQGFLVARQLGAEWELENIVVAPDARRKGIGRRLLDALFARATETNSKAILLEVREYNAAARKLYEKAGFEQTGRRKSYYSNPTEDAILYRHVLISVFS